MSDPKKNAKPSPKDTSSEGIDWAEKLRASMNQTSAEPEPPAASAEEDDLNAMIRAMLDQHDRTVEPVTLDLDTSEFESAEESAEEPIEESAEEPAEESAEEPVEESAEEPVEESAEEPIEESAEEPIEESAEEPAEESAEEPADESAEEPVEESAEEPIEESAEEPIEESAEDPIEESAEEPIEESAEEPADESVEEPVEESAEEPAENPPDTPAFVASAACAPASVTPVRPTVDIPAQLTAEPLSDARFNGLSPNEPTGGSRLARLDARNSQILDERKRSLTAIEEQRVEAAAVSPRPVSDQSAETGAEKQHASFRAPALSESDSSMNRQQDPLQLGLEDILPPETAEVPTLVPSNPEPAPKRRPLYTDSMPAPEGRDKETELPDALLQVQLGYESEFLTADGGKKLEQIREKEQDGRVIPPHSDAAVTNGCKEYKNRTDAPRVDGAYRRARRAAGIRLCVAAVGALFAILYDLYGVLSIPVSEATFADTSPYPLIGVLWTVAVSLIFLPRLGRGVKSLWDFEPTRYAVSALGLAAATANGVIAVFSHSPYLFGGVALFMLTVTALADYLAAVGEHTAFLTVSAGKEAYVLTDEATPAADLTRKTVSENTRVLTAVRTGRVADYFARTCRYNPYMSRLNYFLPVALLAAIVGAGLAVLQDGALLERGIPVFTATYLACLPAAYLLSMALPLWQANRLLLRKGAAVIGTAAPTDYTDACPARLLFADGDALMATHRRDITLRGDSNADEWKALADTVFRMLDSPLAVEPAIRDGGLTRYRIDVTDQGEEYICFNLFDPETEQSLEIMAGSHPALSRRGIRLPKIAMEADYKKSEDSHVLYLAFNRRFHLAYAAEYRVGSTFAHVAESLAALGVGASLISFDPMVDPGMKDIQRLRQHTVVDIVRPAMREPVRKSRSSGMIATGRGLDLLYPYAACYRMREVYRWSHLLGWLGLLLGFGITVLTVLLGRGDLLSSASVVLWQMLSAALSVGLCAVLVNRRRLFLSFPPTPKEASDKKTSDTPSDTPSDTNTK